MSVSGSERKGWRWLDVSWSWPTLGRLCVFHYYCIFILLPPVSPLLGTQLPFVMSQAVPFRLRRSGAG